MEYTVAGGFGQKEKTRSKIWEINFLDYTKMSSDGDKLVVTDYFT